MATRRNEINQTQRTSIQRTAPVVKAAPAVERAEPSPVRANEITSTTLRQAGAESARSIDPSPFSRPLSDDERRARIAEAAYHIAARRGFAPGAELDDWLAAERLVDGAGSPS